MKSITELLRHQLQIKSLITTNMNIHNLSKSDLFHLIAELKLYKSGFLSTEELSSELTEILNAVKQITM